MACAQENDEMLRSLLGSDTGLKLKPINLGTKVIYCDVSTGDIRPYVPKNFRSTIFQALHRLSRPGAKATLDLIRKRFVSKHTNKDIKNKSCIQCQRSKVNRHTKSPHVEYEIPKARFSHVHLNIVGPLLPSKDFVYVLTCLDRFSRWPKAFPMHIQTDETVAETFFAGWVAKFGAPEIITTDQGRQFESDLFLSLARFLGIQKTRTVAYNPKCNGAVERFHRSLKSAIKCHATERWTEDLPSVML
ncbi:hypothetical protein AVEN_206099-1 [Araneus ventricosus]|uniref:RNA-directed DNA polymerase n=1 Tax=Araneus ventricosus TaxID=182803 RepID=A0A4Y2S621_ARAVE|nr:hypothetical protein AVEN_206099-1 [Araneus ventricosus]